MQPPYNPILDSDSYKMCHQFSYPENISGMFSYIEARTNGKDIIIPFGIQMYLEKYLTQQITIKHIDEAEKFLKLHNEPFDRSAWVYIIEKYNGYFPVIIKAIPEGTPIPSGNALVTIECNDPKLFWLSSFIETSIQRALWYPTTIASNGFKTKNMIKGYYDKTGADVSMIPFSVHDFGSRGVSSYETSEIGGAAHLLNFLGSDNMVGVRAMNYFYSDEMSGLSVWATEHSVECSFGKNPEEELEYLKHQIISASEQGFNIVSIVIDGYDVFRAAEQICTKLKDMIIDLGIKVVFRPDSGDMMNIIPRILDLQAATFGFDLNEKGYKKIKHVGLIQGDGVDYNKIDQVLSLLTKLGYASDNIIFGSGGSLLAKVNRDDYKFAQKCSAVCKDGKWIETIKDPITDPGKKSKGGKLITIKSKMTGEYLTVSKDISQNEEFEEVLQVVYQNGKLFNKTSLKEIRNRLEEF